MLMSKLRNTLASIAYLALELGGKFDNHREPSDHDITIAVVQAAAYLNRCGYDDTVSEEMGAISDIKKEHLRHNANGKSHIHMPQEIHEIMVIL
jgi:hypothetical protein